MYTLIINPALSNFIYRNISWDTSSLSIALLRNISESRVQDIHRETENPYRSGLSDYVIHRAYTYLLCHLVVYSDWSGQIIPPCKYSEYHPWFYVITIKKKFYPI